jgi:hypothetical protein
MKGNQWACLLAYVTGLVNQELLLQNEYPAAENRVLRGACRVVRRNFARAPVGSRVMSRKV